MLYEIVHQLLFRPLELLYTKGYPLWQGRPSADICSQLTNVEASFWAQPQNIETCDSLIQKRFNSFFITVGILLYFGAIGTIVGCQFFRWFVLRPLGSEIRRIMTKDK